jgi:ferrochelatase
MEKKGLVFINIGTPEDLSVEAVKRYLKLFLMDKYVIDLPFPLRWILVNMIIAPFRAKKSFEAYKEVWTEKGSPLEVYTNELVTDSKSLLGDEWHIEYAMSYSRPFINDILDKFKSENIKEIYVLPMYPQYAESTSRSTIEAAEDWSKKNPGFKVKTLKYFFNHQSFVSASVEKIRSQIQSLPSDTHYLFSYHGLPFRHVKKLHPNHCKNSKECCATWSDANKFCYRAQCHHTTEMLVKDLDLKEYSYSFQSRLGKDQWLLPYTVNHVKALAESGVKKLAVLPYAFTIDCLETEEEVEAEVKEAFMEAGGEEFHRVECLNRDFSKVLTKEFLGSFA